MEFRYFTMLNQNEKEDGSSHVELIFDGEIPASFKLEDFISPKYVNVFSEKTTKIDSSSEVVLAGTQGAGSYLTPNLIDARTFLSILAAIRKCGWNFLGTNAIKSASPFVIKKSFYFEIVLDRPLGEKGVVVISPTTQPPPATNIIPINVREQIKKLMNREKDKDKSKENSNRNNQEGIKSPLRFRGNNNNNNETSTSRNILIALSSAVKNMTSDFQSNGTSNEESKSNEQANLPPPVIKHMHIKDSKEKTKDKTKEKPPKPHINSSDGSNLRNSMAPLLLGIREPEVYSGVLYRAPAITQTMFDYHRIVVTLQRGKLKMYDHSRVLIDEVYLRGYIPLMSSELRLHLNYLRDDYDDDCCEEDGYSDYTFENRDKDLSGGRPTMEWISRFQEHIRYASAMECPPDNDVFTIRSESTNSSSTHTSVKSNGTGGFERLKALKAENQKLTGTPQKRINPLSSAVGRISEVTNESDFDSRDVNNSSTSTATMTTLSTTSSTLPNKSMELNENNTSSISKRANPLTLATSNIKPVRPPSGLFHPPVIDSSNANVNGSVFDDVNKNESTNTNSNGNLNGNGSKVQSMIQDIKVRIASSAQNLKASSKSLKSIPENKKIEKDMASVSNISSGSYGFQNDNSSKIGSWLSKVTPVSASTPPFTPRTQEANCMQQQEQFTREGYPIQNIPVTTVNDDLGFIRESMVGSNHRPNFDFSSSSVNYFSPDRERERRITVTTAAPIYSKEKKAVPILTMSRNGVLVRQTKVDNSFDDNDRLSTITPLNRKIGESSQQVALVNEQDFCRPSIFDVLNDLEHNL